MVTVIAKTNSLNCESGYVAKMLGCKKNIPYTDVAIRWGCTRNIPADRYINTSKAIHNASDKLKSLVLMDQAEVPHVKYFYVEEKGSTTFPLYGRKIHHTKGKDIVIINNEIELATDTSDFYTASEKIYREYRVHVFRNKTLTTIKFKVPGNGGLDPNPNNPDIMRNWNSGWRFAGIQNPNKMLVDVAKRAVKSLALDFGAVDLIENEEGRYLVLEVNTAPGLDDIRRAWYIDCIREAID